MLINSLDTIDEGKADATVIADYQLFNLRG